MNDPMSNEGTADSGSTAGPVVVAIDGPAGSGKSSVSRAAARVLGYGFLDTGAAYRAATWSAVAAGVETSDAEAVAGVVDAAVRAGEYRIGTDPEGATVSVGETDVTTAIRAPEITAQVSAVARIPRVRAVLTDLFRHLIATTRQAGVVVEGRDITTVVAPDAQVRILLTASEEARMARRSAEVPSQPAHVTAHALRTRDAADLRVIDFMNAADGVLTVDSTDLDFDETVAAVVDVVHSETARTSHGSQ